MKRRLILWITLTALLSAPVALAKEKSGPSGDHADHAQKPGEVHFPTSCKKTVQKSFDRGVALLHSFWYEEAKRAFDTVIEKDPECAMGYWGIAMSFYHPLWEPPDAATLKRGWTYAERAKKAAKKNAREKEYLAAIGAFYKDSDRLDHRTRALAYEKAMEQIYLHYPEDKEAAVFYALALNATAPPTDKSYANQKKGAEILNKVLAEAPNHPGAIHYLIHAYDSPQLAPLALSAARSYAKIAPAVPHALHMPSHIFTRLGLWEESIESNRASIAAARRYEGRMKMKGAWSERLHAMDYLLYADLQRGDDGAARSVLSELNALRKSGPENLSAAYASTAIPVRYAMERRQWVEAATLATRPSRYPQAEALIYYAGAVSMARLKRGPEAEINLARLKSLHEDLVKAKERYWADQVELLLQEAGGWFEFSDGKNDAALAHMRAAVVLEEAAEKTPMTPGPIIPAREMLGDLLLQLDEPKEALAEFEASLQTSPNRFNGLYGAARAAERAEDLEKARDYYQKLVAVADPRSDRPELGEAKAFLEKNGGPAPAKPAPPPSSR